MCDFKCIVLEGYWTDFNVLISVGLRSTRLSSSIHSTHWLWKFGEDGYLENSGTIQTSEEPSAGDVTLNGNINVADAILMVEYILGEYDLNTMQLIAGDLNDSGHINVTDVVLLVEMILDF